MKYSTGDNQEVFTGIIQEDAAAAARQISESAYSFSDFLKLFNRHKDNYTVMKADEAEKSGLIRRINDETAVVPVPEKEKRANVRNTLSRKYYENELAKAFYQALAEKSKDSFQDEEDYNVFIALQDMSMTEEAYKKNMQFRNIMAKGTPEQKKEAVSRRLEEIGNFDLSFVNFTNDQNFVYQYEKYAKLKSFPNFYVGMNFADRYGIDLNDRRFAGYRQNAYLFTDLGELVQEKEQIISGAMYDSVDFEKLTGEDLNYLKNDLSLKKCVNADLKAAGSLAGKKAEKSAASLFLDPRIRSDEQIRRYRSMTKAPVFHNAEPDPDMDAGAAPEEEDEEDLPEIKNLSDLRKAYRDFYKGLKDADHLYNFNNSTQYKNLLASLEKADKLFDSIKGEVPEAAKQSLLDAMNKVSLNAQAYQTAKRGQPANENRQKRLDICENILKTQRGLFNLKDSGSRYAEDKKYLNFLESDTLYKRVGNIAQRIADAEDKTLLKGTDAWKCNRASRVAKADLLQLIRKKDYNREDAHELIAEIICCDKIQAGDRGIGGLNKDIMRQNIEFILWTDAFNEQFKTEELSPVAILRFLDTGSDPYINKLRNAMTEEEQKRFDALGSRKKPAEKTEQKEDMIQKEEELNKSVFSFGEELKEGGIGTQADQGDYHPVPDLNISEINGSFHNESKIDTSFIHDAQPEEQKQETSAKEENKVEEPESKKTEIKESKTEESKPEENKAEEPKKEEPKKEESKKEEPKKEEPKVEKSEVEAPKSVVKTSVWKKDAADVEAIGDDVNAELLIKNAAEARAELLKMAGKGKIKKSKANKLLTKVYCCEKLIPSQKMKSQISQEDVDKVVSVRSEDVVNKALAREINSNVINDMLSKGGMKRFESSLNFVKGQIDNIVEKTTELRQSAMEKLRTLDTSIEVVQYMACVIVCDDILAQKDTPDIYDVEADSIKDTIQALLEEPAFQKETKIITVKDIRDFVSEGGVERFNENLAVTEKRMMGGIKLNIE